MRDIKQILRCIVKDVDLLMSGKVHLIPTKHEFFLTIPLNSLKKQPICAIFHNEGVYVMTNELLTVAQAAQYLQVCEKTVRRLINNQKLTASKVGSRAWRIRKEAIDEYLTEHTNGTKGVSTK